MSGAEVASQGSTPHPLACLLRRFAIEFLTCQRWDALDAIMDPDYVLHIGGHDISGREAQYRPAMAAAFAQFPGLNVTVHDVLLGERAVAMHFTEHGASRKDAGRRAAWQGISLFRLHAGRMMTGWAEEDYAGRKRQLRSGNCDPVAAPHASPWDEPVREAVPEVGEVVRRWLEQGLDDSGLAVRWAGTGATARDLLLIERVIVDECFAAGDRAAFHVTVTGRYRGGLDEIASDRVGHPVSLHAAGIVRTAAGRVVEGAVVPDLLGLQRCFPRAR